MRIFRRVGHCENSKTGVAQIDNKNWDVTKREEISCKDKEKKDNILKEGENQT